MKYEVKVYKNILQELLNRNPDEETKDWIQNLIQCFDYILNDKNDFPAKCEIYNDLLNTLYLLYQWLFNKEWWAWFELKQKYRTINSPESVGKALKTISDRLKQSVDEGIDNILGFQNTATNIDSEEQIEILKEQ